MALLSPVARQQFFVNGQPAAGHLLYTYAANTTTPQATYSNRGGTIPNTNPIVLDAEGRSPTGIYLPSGLVYDYVFKTALGVTVYTQEDVEGDPLATDLASADTGKGAALMAFLQSGTGAAIRTALDKMREVQVSVMDFDAVGDGVADDRLPLLNAVTEADGRDVVIPAGKTILIASNLTLPANTRLVLEAGASITTSGGATFSNLGSQVELQARSVLGTQVGGTHRFQYGTGQGTGNRYNFNTININGDDVDQEAGVGTMTGSKVNGLQVFHEFGGAAARGGRHAIEGVAIQVAANSTGSSDYNYVGVQGQCLTSTCDGGILGSPRGSYFGSSSYGGITGGTHALNLTGAEINTEIVVGSGDRVSAHTGVQIASRMGERGYNIDAALSISNISGTGWKNGILFSSLNGISPFVADSTAIKFDATAGALDCVLDASAVTYTSLIKGVGITIGASGNLEVGRLATANSPFIDFHSSASLTDYDARITCSDGTASTGAGNLRTLANSVSMPFLAPLTDNVHKLGDTALRWTQLSAATATINTSDERQKQQIEGIPDEWLDAWADVEYVRYKWNDSVEAKGEGARWHTGVIAQRVRDAFAARGLDATTIGLLCFDKWEAKPATYFEDGTVNDPGYPAGDRWGVRGEECLYLESALLRREIERLRKK